MIKNNWFVYLVECKDGSFYTGITNDLEKRMNAHINGNGRKYVLAKGFKEIIAYKKCADKSEACKHEYFVKQLQHNKKAEWFRKTF